MDDLLDLNNMSWSNSSTNTSSQKENKPKQDIFADLLSFSSSSSSTTPTPVPTLNEQRMQANPILPSSINSSPQTSRPLTPVSNAALQQQQQQQLPKQPLLPRSQPSNSSPTTHPSNSLDNLLDPFGKANKQKQSSNLPLNALRSETISQNNNSNSNSDPWDFDLLSSSLKNNTRNACINCNDEDDDSNPLGILAQPVNNIITKNSPNISENETSSPKDSPKIHQQDPTPYDDELLAQLVEMGFGIEESKIALEASGNIDLQSAIDIIVQQTEAIRQQQEQSRLKKEKKINMGNDNNGMERTSSPTSSANNDLSFQQHKERLVTQATEIGGFLYKNASLFVKSGKQKISKAMEDWQEQGQGQGQQQRQDRPKWMTDMVDHDSMDDINIKNGSHLEKYVDSDDDDNDVGDDKGGNNEKNNEEDSIKMMENERRQMDALRQRQLQQQQKQKQKQKISKSLFDDDEDEYISPSRRRHTPPPSKSKPKPQQQQPATIQRQTPEPIPKKQIIEVPTNILTIASNDRERGNELYKLGQFGEAEMAYTKGLTSLPEGHYHLILFSNNRAMTRLKTGDYKSCIQDCDLAIHLSKEIVTHYNGKVHCQGVDIHGKDQLIKALHRKAEALEHLENYEKALDTYQLLVQWEGVGNIKVNHALARCRKIVNGSTSSSSSSSTSSSKIISNNNNNKKPSSSTPKPSSSPNIKDSKAVAAMRAQAAQQEKDDAERLAKTDQVNDRLAQWKQGKELNLRALLATLDTLLWVDAQWKPIQMSDLIQPKKCKIQYLKAISKVHPDKLPSTVTVEQRMIASGIFSTLNEAWDTFKAQNNL
ncbi:hypothetical protein BJ944DRAFT_230581 [Cunninghamella echinulata]|nr:hypothetical protein BJ944DRAFT_230581 [Cunninghamella echinulata]